VPVLSSYVGDHAALPRMSANADFSTLLKCLASGKKSIEQLRPSAPRQTSALELLEVYCFRILLVYPCALYYGMLILSRALGACPTPPESAHNQHYEYLITLWILKLVLRIKLPSNKSWRKQYVSLSGLEWVSRLSIIQTPWDPPLFI